VDGREPASKSDRVQAESICREISQTATSCQLINPRKESGINPMVCHELTPTVLQEHSLTRPQIQPVYPLPKRCVVEVLGPAGAGKTTLLKSLRESYVPVQDRLPLLWSDKVRALGSILCELLPGYLGYHSTSRWFNLEELRRMSYVKAWHRVLMQSSAAQGTITVLDHGPIFMLGMVQEFGPQLVKGRHFARWSEGAIAAWSNTLDMVLWLDAPDTTLIERINCRGNNHVIKGRPFREASIFLQRCRFSYEQILSEISVSGRPQVFRFDTSNISTDDIVNQLLQTVGAPPTVAQ